MLTDRQAGPQTPTPPPEVRYDVDRDPREDEPWFRQLPEQEQQRLRDGWHQRRHRHDGDRRAWWLRVWRACWSGGLLFLVIGFLQGVFVGLGPAIPLALCGAVAAALACACGGGRFAYSVAGALAFVVGTGSAATTVTSWFSPFAMVGLLMCSYGLGALGLEREMEQRGGFAQRKR